MTCVFPGAERHPRAVAGRLSRTAIAAANAAARANAAHRVQQHAQQRAGRRPAAGLRGILRTADADSQPAGFFAGSAPPHGPAPPRAAFGPRRRLTSLDATGRRAFEQELRSRVLRAARRRLAAGRRLLASGSKPWSGASPIGRAQLRSQLASVAAPAAAAPTPAAAEITPAAPGWKLTDPLSSPSLAAPVGRGRGRARGRRKPCSVAAAGYHTSGPS